MSHLRSRFAEQRPPSSPPNLSVASEGRLFSGFIASASCEGMLKAEEAALRKAGQQSALDAHTCALLCRKQLARCEQLRPLTEGTAQQAQQARERARAGLDANPSLHANPGLRHALCSFKATAEKAASSMERCVAQLDCNTEALQQSIALLDGLAEESLLDEESCEYARCAVVEGGHRCKAARDGCTISLERARNARAALSVSRSELHAAQAKLAKMRAASPRRSSSPRRPSSAPRPSSPPRSPPRTASPGPRRAVAPPDLIDPVTGKQRISQPRFH